MLLTTLYSNEIGLILSYENFYKIARFQILDQKADLVRHQKPIKKGDLPNSTIVSFAIIEGYNEKNRPEIVIMFHFLDQLYLYWLKSSSMNRPFPKQLKKRNIIEFDNRIFFWEDKGRAIDRLEHTIKNEKTYFYKAYDAKNAIKVGFCCLSNEI